MDAAANRPIRPSGPRDADIDRLLALDVPIWTSRTADRIHLSDGCAARPGADPDATRTVGELLEVDPQHRCPLCARAITYVDAFLAGRYTDADACLALVGAADTDERFEARLVAEVRSWYRWHPMGDTGCSIGLVDSSAALLLWVRNVPAACSEDDDLLVDVARVTTPELLEATNALTAAMATLAERAGTEAWDDGRCAAIAELVAAGVERSDDHPVEAVDEVIDEVLDQLRVLDGRFDELAGPAVAVMASDWDLTVTEAFAVAADVAA